MLFPVSLRKFVLSLGVGALSAMVVFPSAGLAGWIGTPVNTIHISGNTKFELRHTVTTFADGVECQTKICEEVKPYWVVLLQNGTSVFEINEAFNYNSERSPESIELAGVRIRPGERISVDGELDSLDSDSGIISDVTHVDVLMDLETVSQPTSWHCHGNLSASEEVFAEVWFSSNDGNNRLYHLKATVASGLGDRVETSLVASDHAVELRAGDEYSYRALENSVDARLSVMRTLPVASGSLELSRYVSDLRVPIASKISLTCIADNALE